MTENTENLVISQKKLKLLLGGLGVGLPTVLYFGNLLIYGVPDILGSLSKYYHSELRDVFVGVLFSMGVFLVAYEGYSIGDRLLSSFGGVLAIAVALFPTASPDAVRTNIAYIHLIAAATFYLVLAIFCIFLFTKTDELKPPTFMKKVRNTFYYFFGLVIISCLVLLVLTESGILVSPIDKSTFWLESIANSAFGYAWLIKGEGVFFLNDDSIFKWDPWEIFGLIILLLLILGNFMMISFIFLS